MLPWGWGLRAWCCLLTPLKASTDAGGHFQGFQITAFRALFLRPRCGVGFTFPSLALLFPLEGGLFAGRPVLRLAPGRAAQRHYRSKPDRVLR